MMPYASSPRRPPEPFRYPSAQEAEWRMLVAEAAHARGEGWECAPEMAERAAVAGERMLIAEAEAEAATPASRWARGLGAVSLLILLAVIAGLVG